MNGYIIFLSAVILLHQIYFFTAEILWNGKTIGKRIFKIKVISKDGANPDLITSFVRNFSRSIYFPGVWGLVMLWPEL